MKMQDAMNALTSGQTVDVSRVVGSATPSGKSTGVIPGSKVERQVSLG